MPLVFVYPIPRMGVVVVVDEGGVGGVGGVVVVLSGISLLIGESWSDCSCGCSC